MFVSFYRDGADAHFLQSKCVGGSYADRFRFGLILPSSLPFSHGTCDIFCAYILLLKSDPDTDRATRFTDYVSKPTALSIYTDGTNSHLFVVFDGFILVL